MFNRRLSQLVAQGSRKPDVLIVGAGASGLILAIDLARRGINFRLIEKLDGPFRGSRGKGLQPRTLEVFEDLGFLDRIFATGTTSLLRRVYDIQDGVSFKDSVFMEHFEPIPAEPYRNGIIIPQFLTEGIMRERLLELGCSPDFSCELTDFKQNEKGVEVRVSSPKGEETFQVPYLVGADGGRSFVRHKLEMGFPGKTLGVRAIVADVVLEGLSQDRWHFFGQGTQLPCLVCPLPGTDLFQLQSGVLSEGDVDLSPEGLTALIVERTKRKDIVVRSVNWASVYSMNARLADHYQAGRVFLVGDSAHVHPPTGGQGLNTSVQDAYNLGWKLAAVLKGAPDKLLLTYEEERRPVAAQMLGLASKLLDEAKKGKVERGREVRQLDIGYSSWSSLVIEHPKRSSGVRAGDRAPDAQFKSASGMTKRLFQLFQGPHWTLLGYQADSKLVEPRPGMHIHMIGSGKEIVDEKDQIRDGYNLKPGDWVLVRPDGYVGAILSSENIDKLDSYLAGVGLSK